jgi:hypothetical protein
MCIWSTALPGDVRNTSIAFSSSALGRYGLCRLCLFAHGDAVLALADHHVVRIRHINAPHFVSF